MFLEKISVSGYRGISRLSLNFEKQTVLIGENSWGKSSLLRALWCILGNGDIPYEFTEDDFRKEYGDNDESVSRTELMLVLTFRELFLGTANKAKHLRAFKPVWQKCLDTYHRIFYFIKGEMNDKGTVFTTHGFLDEHGYMISLEDSLPLVQYLLTLNPVFRLRDSRSVIPAFLNMESPKTNFELSQNNENLDNDNGYAETKKYSHNGKYFSQTQSNDFSQNLYLEDRIKKLFTSVVSSDGDQISKKLIKEGVDSVNIILEHYFSVMPPFMRQPRQGIRTTWDIVNKPISNNSFGSLYTILKKSNKKTLHLFLALIAGSMLLVRGERKIDKHARPIVIFEDIESRLHPTILHDLWSVIELLPIQQIITTNSGDLLSSISLTSIRRLCRRVNSTVSYSIDTRDFNEDELRKIAFHIRLNRPMSLFARCWLLVEGETEIWLLNEFAAILGINLVAEGIRLVEYAQCGVTPLIKLAQQLGIAWYLMADGDDAGVHYVNMAEKGGNQDNVVLLPSRDIEHFLYENGFDNVYRLAAGYERTKNVTKNKVIEVALRRFTKPGMALAVADEARRRGKKSIPELLQKLMVKAMINSM
jgi:putative ATP-dependent endonuclease of the OLD family